MFYTATPEIDPPLQSDVFAVVGDSLTLSCTSRGSPPDTFSWVKDGLIAPLSPSLTSIIHNTTTAIFITSYTIHNATTSDSGVYTCTVTNPIGSDSETVNVTIVTGEYIITFSTIRNLHYNFTISLDYMNCTNDHSVRV